MNRGLSICQLCDEPMLPGERLSPSLFNGLHVHHECGFRAVVGGANHIMGRCTCCGGTEPPDPPGLTPRDAARAAVAAWENIHGFPGLYETAKQIAHDFGFDWTDPRTGITYPPPTRRQG